MTKIVTISLDEQSHKIWKKLPQKSAWVREMLGHHAVINFGADDLRHYTTKRVRDSRPDGKCNPYLKAGKCPLCWPLEEEEEE